MKKLIVFLMVFLVLVSVTVQAQQEIVLKQLGRAPLSPYLQSAEEAKILLKKVNEEVGRALDWFPGGALGEAVYAALYEQLPNLKLEQVQVPVGQRMVWMLYSKGRLLKGLRWEGSEPFQAYQFEVITEGKIFTFIVPLRCGNIALVGMREAPVVAPQPQSVPASPSPAPQPPASQSAPEPAPVKPAIAPRCVQSWSPTLKIKVGAGWGGMTFPVPVDSQTQRIDFFSLVPSTDTVAYCPEGTAIWYYTSSDSTPFALNQHINLWQHQVEHIERKKVFPFYAEIEMEIWQNIFVSGSFFQLGKYASSNYVGKEQMVIDEIRFLGSYYSFGSTGNSNCSQTNVYYIGLHREWNELLVREEARIQEFTAGLKYQLKLGKKFFVEPEVGMLWQVRRGNRITDTTQSKLYPFKEEPLVKEVVTEVVEKIKTTTSSPYVGIALEAGPFFVQARRAFLKKENDLLKISPWRIQGGILLKF